MKNGTVFGARVKKAYAKLKQSVPPPDIPEADDPLHRLAVAILGVGSSDALAASAIDRAFNTLVDWNEIRVSSEQELNKAMGNCLPHGVERCAQLIAALQSVFDHENRMSLDRLKGMGRRDAKHLLEQLAGVDEYAVASIILWSLGGHAIPVNDKLLETLRAAELVNEESGRGEIQAFLERHVSAAEAKAFCLLMPALSVTPRTASKRTRKAGTTTRKKAKSSKKAS